MFLWNFLAFFNDPVDVGNLIYGSSVFSKTILNIWKFTVHILLKPGLENFKHHFTSVWDECNCVIVWAFFGIAFLWNGMKTDLFQSCGYCWVFQLWGYGLANLILLCVYIPVKQLIKWTVVGGNWLPCGWSGDLYVSLGARRIHVLDALLLETSLWTQSWLNIDTSGNI